MEIANVLHDEETLFELKSNTDSPGMARLQINCMVSIPVGIRILACLMEGAPPSAYPKLEDVSAEG